MYERCCYKQGVVYSFGMADTSAGLEASAAWMSETD